MGQAALAMMTTPPDAKSKPSIRLVETERNAELVAEMLEKARRVERADALHAIARYLNSQGHHEAAELIRTDLSVFRFMRAGAR